MLYDIEIPPPVLRRDAVLTTIRCEIEKPLQLLMEGLGLFSEPLISGHQGSALLGCELGFQSMELISNL